MHIKEKTGISGLTLECLQKTQGRQGKKKGRTSMEQGRLNEFRGDAHNRKNFRGETQTMQRAVIPERREKKRMIKYQRWWMNCPPCAGVVGKKSD